ncbi:MAG: hypothetical protein U5N58_06145 [Actinomycetota bacterium]|nr:hypothetical protein [Actinomycetota bacterium]
MLQLFYEGKSDSDIRNITGTRSNSTITKHRFNFKEEEQQSKIFLTLMELLQPKDNPINQFINVNKKSKMIDHRYNVTVEEKDKIIKNASPWD